VRGLVRKVIAEFMRTRTDVWKEQKRQFTQDQLESLNDFTAESLSYVA